MKILNKLKGKTYVSTFINRVMYAAVLFIANALISRALGVELKGEYTWIINAANIIAIVAGLGVYHSIPYFNRQKTEDDDIVQRYINIFTLQAIVYLLISAVIIAFTGVKISIISICVLVIMDTFSQELNMLILIVDIFKRNKILLAGAYFNLITSALGYLFFKDNVVAAIIILAMFKGFYIIFYLVAMKKIPNPFAVSMKKLGQIIKFGYMPMLSFLLITLNYKVDLLMLKGLHVAPKQLSYYSVGVQVAELAWFIPDVFKEVLFSKTAKKNNYDEVSAVLRISNLVMVIIILGVVAFGKVMLWIFYGAPFLPAYKVTILIFAGIPAMSWFKIIYTLFNAQGRRKTSFFVLLLSACTNIVANYVAIPVIGIYGAALASIISYSVCGIVFIFLYSKVSGDPVHSLLIMKKNDIKVLKK